MQNYEYQAKITHTRVQRPFPLCFNNADTATSAHYGARVAHPSVDVPCCDLVDGEPSRPRGSLNASTASGALYARSAVSKFRLLYGRLLNRDCSNYFHKLPRAIRLRPASKAPPVYHTGETRGRVSAVELAVVKLGGASNSQFFNRVAAVPTSLTCDVVQDGNVRARLLRLYGPGFVCGLSTFVMEDTTRDPNSTSAQSFQNKFYSHFSPRLWVSHLGE